MFLSTDASIKDPDLEDTGLLASGDLQATKSKAHINKAIILLIV
jgi:hypothetical protein